MTEWIDVAPADAVGNDDVIAASANGRPIALFQCDGQFFALHDLCSHGQARLSDGYVEGGTVECPLHQGLICIRTGEPRSAPITAPVTSYPTRVVDGRIQIKP